MLSMNPKRLRYGQVAKAIYTVHTFDEYLYCLREVLLPHRFVFSCDRLNYSRFTVRLGITGWSSQPVVEGS